MRIIWCNTGDSPRGHGGRRAPAAAGRAVKSSQTGQSPETATTAPLPGTVPAVADTGEMRRAVASKNGPLRPKGAWHLQRRDQPHGGSLRAKSPRHRPRQRAHLRCETQPGASAQPLRRLDRLHRDKACGGFQSPGNTATTGAMHLQRMQTSRCMVQTSRCMAPAAKIPENLLASASFGAAPGTVPAGTAAGVHQRPLAGR